MLTRSTDTTQENRRGLSPLSGWLHPALPTLASFFRSVNNPRPTTAWDPGEWNAVGLGLAEPASSPGLPPSVTLLQCAVGLFYPRRLGLPAEYLVNILYCHRTRADMRITLS